MSRHDTRDLAEAGYKAYGDSVGWVNHAGNSMPSWRELPAPQRRAWLAATTAIAQQLLATRRPA